MKTIVRESPVLEALEHLKPKWSEINGMRVAASLRDVHEERRIASELAICDVSGLARLTIKGPGGAAWLQKHGNARHSKGSHPDGLGLQI